MGRWGCGSVAICCAISFAAGVLLMRERCHRRSRAGATATTTVSPSEGPAHGMSHTVTALLDGEVVTTMKEGPDGPQVRCETESLPCSYLELKALAQSGAVVPPELRMTRAELRTLVAQLDTVSAHLSRYRNNITQACIDGYRVKSSQVRNMGIHMANPAYMGSKFDLTKPQILLFATPTKGADQLTQQQLGDCVNGRWTGDPHQQIVGAAFLQFGNNHPDGFAGPLDNWHIHYHVCIGTDSIAVLLQQECEKHGGHYLASTGWMLHTFVVPEFDDHLGVFSQWNPSIWPKTSAQVLAAAKAHNMAGMEQMMGTQRTPGHDRSQ